MSRLTRTGLAVSAGAGAVAVAAALVTGLGQTREQAPAVSPAAATESAVGAPAAGATAPHGAWDHGSLRDRLEELPEELRADLVALRDVPAGERLAEVERIRDAALAGEYGADAKAGAERLVAGLAMLPAELTADLEALVATENAQVPDAVERIRDRALDGDYGARVQAHAERALAMAEERGYDLSGDLDRFVPDPAD
jgi:hypothetical protein